MGRLRRIFEPRPIEKFEGKQDSEDFRKERKRLSENHYLRSQALAAWLLASLVAVNSGGIALKLVDREHAVPFAAGIVLALISGFASWQEAQDRSGLHYVESLEQANITAYGEQRRRTWRWRWRVLNVVAKLTNLGSLGAFIIGCVMIAGA